jgi:hypothetical protein
MDLQSYLLVLMEVTPSDRTTDSSELPAPIEIWSEREQGTPSGPQILFVKLILKLSTGEV